MARGKSGADSNGLVTDIAYDDKNLLQAAIKLMGETPVFWGSYFKGPHNSSHEQYQPALENETLNSNSIKLLPLARQTDQVHGSEAQGQQAARNNVEALFAAFSVHELASQGGSFYMFLDTEPRPRPALSINYYTGWAKTVVSYSRENSAGRVTILPGVYLNHNNIATCNAITAAVQNNGAECHGVYVARYLRDKLPCPQPVDWNESHIHPEVPLPCKVLIWQYAGDCFDAGLLDGNQVNPAIDLLSEFLDKLILPPSP